MINRDENGTIISADKLSDVTSALKDIENRINEALKKGDSISAEEKAELDKSAKDLQVLFSIVTPELQKKSGPIEVMNYLKQIVNIKKIADKLKETKHD